MTYEQARELVKNALRTNVNRPGTNVYKICLSYPVPTIVALCRAICPKSRSKDGVIGSWVQQVLDILGERGEI